MSSPYVVILDDRFQHYREEESVLRPLGARIEVKNPRTEAQIIAAVKDADALVVNLYPITATVIRSLTRCKIICRYGIGYDNIDIDAATAAGIWVSRVPDYGLEDVSDHAVAMLTACARQLTFSDRKVRDGQWNFPRHTQSYRIKDRVLGLVGYGAIARMVHRKVTGFGLKQVLAYDPYVPADTMRAAGAEPAELNRLFKEADYISVHSPLTPETRHLIDAAAIASMKPTTVIVNTARGGIIDEVALAAALKSGKLRFAGIDVFETEPLPMDSPLRSVENIILTDHAAYYTEEALVDLKTKAARNVAAVLQGKEPLVAVNKVG